MNPGATSAAVLAPSSSVMLVLQSVPYAAAVIVSLISAAPSLPASWIGETGSMQQAAHTVLDPDAAGE